MTTPKRWEEEFEEKFPYKIAEVVDDFGSTIKSDIKSFISKVEATARESLKSHLIEELKGMKKIPLGDHQIMSFNYALEEVKKKIKEI